MSQSFSPQWQSCVTGINSTLNQGIEKIAAGGVFMACIVDQNRRLIAILTDSDVRTSLLKGASSEDAILKWANLNPLVAEEGASESELANIVIASGKRELPIVNKLGQLVDVYVYGHSPQAGISNLSSAMAVETVDDTPVFILAGGLGSRLRSIVSDRPKPLAEVGGKPVLQTVIEHIAKFGFKTFYISVNYMAEQIEEHLQQSFYNHLKVNIVRETARLGTAGSIGYIRDQISEPLIVCNADVLSTISFSALIRRHMKAQADVSCVVRSHEVLVPFGLIEVDKNENIVSIREKPRFQHLVNAGIYVLSPEVVKMIEPGEYLDMPDLLRKLLDMNKKIVPFLAHEYCLDVGSPESYETANAEYSLYFGSENA